MSHWNIRILHGVYPDHTEYFFPAEVYYDGGGRPYAYGNYSPDGESLHDVEQYAKDVILATRKPVLMSGDAFPQEYDPTKNGSDPHHTDQ